MSNPTDQAADAKAAEIKATLVHAGSSLSSETSGHSNSGAMPMEVDDDAMFERKPPKSIKTESGQVGTVVNLVVFTTIPVHAAMTMCMTTPAQILTQDMLKVDQQLYEQVMAYSISCAPTAWQSTPQAQANACSNASFVRGMTSLDGMICTPTATKHVLSW